MTTSPTKTPSSTTQSKSKTRSSSKRQSDDETKDDGAAIDDSNNKKETNEAMEDSSKKETTKHNNEPSSSKPKGRTRSSSGASMELEMNNSSSSKKQEKEGTDAKVEKDTPVTSSKKTKKNNRKRSSSMGSTGSTGSSSTRKRSGGDEKASTETTASAKATNTTTTPSNNNNDNNDETSLPTKQPSSPKQQRGRTRSSSGASMMDMSPVAVATDDSTKKDQKVSSLAKSSATAVVSVESNIEKKGRKRSASLGNAGGGSDGIAKGGRGESSTSQMRTRNRSRSLSGGSSKELQKTIVGEENKAAAATATAAAETSSTKVDKTSTSTSVSPKKKQKKNNPLSSSEGSGKDSKRKEEDNKGEQQPHSKSPSKKNVQDSKDKQGHKQQKPPPQKRAPTMDVVVHRIRHFNYQPTQIVCMRASPALPPTNMTKDYNLLAISRGNGSVELHAMNEKARIIATIAGFHDEQRHVSTMTWIGGGGGDSGSSEPPTLIGASPDGSIFIIDFMRNQFSGMISSGGGGVFALTSLLGRRGGRVGLLVAAGCQDGSVRILQCKKNPTSGRQSLEIVSTLPSASAAVLSVAWQPRTKISDGAADKMDMDDDDANMNNMGGSVLYAGIADGTIRRYDCLAAADGAVDDGSNSSCRWKASHRMTVESHGRQIPTRIWALETLQDGTVISGDSLGHVQFWDGQTGSLLQSLDQTDTKADVLDIAVSADECKVFCSGVDSRVICIERKQKQQQAGIMQIDDDDEYRPWILSNAQRPHTHDVKAVTMCREPVMSREETGQVQVQQTEILCTGGVDTKLCTYSVANFQRQRPRIIYPWPSFSPVSVASTARLVSFMRNDCIDLYRLGKKSHPVKVREPAMVPEEETLVGTVKVKGPSALACSTLSDNGQYLVASDGTIVYLFSIALGKDNAFSASRLSVDLPTRLSVVSVKFIRDDCLLLAATDGRIILLEFRKRGSGDEVDMDGGSESADQEVVVIVKQIIESNKDEHSLHTLLPVHSMISTSCGNWFAVFRNELGGQGKVEIYSTSGVDNALYHREWVVPKLDSPVSAITFLESKNPQLAVACVNFALYVFDIKVHRLNTWSEAAGFPLSSSIPADLASRRDFPVRLSADQTCPSKVLMCSFGAFVVMDMKNDFPNCCRIFPETHVRYKRNRPTLAPEGIGERKETKKSEAVLCLRYNSMLYLGFVGPKEMIVVEQPWLNVVANFPDALQRRIYGA